MEVKLPAIWEIFTDRQTNQLTNQPTDGRELGVIEKLHLQEGTNS